MFGGMLADIDRGHLTLNPLMVCIVFAAVGTWNMENQAAADRVPPGLPTAGTSGLASAHRPRNRTACSPAVDVRCSVSRGGIHHTVAVSSWFVVAVFNGRRRAVVERRFRRLLLCGAWKAKE